jgi:hypothetical protein
MVALSGRARNAMAKGGLSGRAEAGALSSRGGDAPIAVSLSRRPFAAAAQAGLSCWRVWRRAGLVPATAPPTFFP